MRPPFSMEQFLGVFGRYNEAVWPLQALFYVAAAVMVALAVRPRPGSDRWISGLLAFFWAWMGVVYHWGFFLRINPAALLFGAFFLLQALLFLVAAAHGPGLRFRAHVGLRGVAGAVLVGYALVAYPLLGHASGHTYPEAPTFGLPCPTTIFTFGLLLWAERRVPPWLVAVPALWSIVGSSAAFWLTITEDYGLLAAGLAGTALLLAGSTPRGTAASPGPPAR